MDMKISFPSGKKVDADYKGFTIKTDQPRHGGGDGSAPEPFSLFIKSGRLLLNTFRQNEEKSLI